MVKYESEILLQDGASIDEKCDRIAKILTAEKLDRKFILRIKLSVEEVLLLWRDNDALGQCEILLKKKSGSLQLALSMKSPCCDPFQSKANDASDGENFGRNLMANLGVDFKFRYWRGVNYVTLSSKKKRNTLREMAVVIGSAAVLGGLINRFAPQFAQMSNQYVLTPLLDCVFGFLSAVIGPFMFLAVVWTYERWKCGRLG